MKRLFNTLIIKVLLLGYFSSNADCPGGTSFVGPESNQVCAMGYAKFSTGDYDGKEVKWETTYYNSSIRFVQDRELRDWWNSFFVMSDYYNKPAELNKLNYSYPYKLVYKEKSGDNDEVTAYYSDGYIIPVSIIPDYKPNCRLKSVTIAVPEVGKTFEVTLDVVRTLCSGTRRRTITPYRVSPDAAGTTLVGTNPACAVTGSYSLQNNANFPWGSIGETSISWTYKNVNGTVVQTQSGGTTFAANAVPSPGTYEISAYVSSPCGAKNLSRQFTVADPFAVTPARMYFNNSTTSYAWAGATTTYLFAPTCDQAYRINAGTAVSNLGSCLSVPSYPGGVYTFNLPKGWKIYNNGSGVALPTRVVNADGSFTYVGNFAQLGYIRITSTTPNEYRGEGIIDGGNGSVTISTCSRSETIYFHIRPHTALDVQLPTDVTTCAGSYYLVSKIKSDANSPYYTINWTTNLGTLLFASNGTASGASHNQITGSTYATHYVRATISDGRCTSDETASNVILNAPIATNGTWNSGILSDDRSLEVNSNVQYSSVDNKVWVVANEKGNANNGIYYYEYNPVSGWIPKPPFLSPNPAVAHQKIKAGVNSLLDLPAPAFLGKSLYYIGVNSVGTGAHVRYISTAGSPDGITGGNTHSDVAELFDYVSNATPKFSKIYYRRSNGFLGFFDGQAGTSNDFVNEVTKFDVTINNGKVFYIDNAGALWAKQNGSLSNLAQNIAPANTFIPYAGNTTGYTDLVFDNAGNLYYVRNGALFYRQPSESFTVEYATVVSIATLSGNFSINKATGTIYAVATNRSVYQFFRNPGWATKKAVNTYGAINDMAGTYPVFDGGHLFYIAKTTNQSPRQDWAVKTVFNLYFIDNCTPSPMRKSSVDVEDVMDKETADYETGLQASVHPNPFQEELTLEMDGTGDAEVRIYNMNGKEVRTFSYAFGKITINTEDLKPGLYTLAVYQDGKRLVAKKVVK